MSANHFGHQADLASLRRFAMSLKGATRLGQIRIADHIGLATRPLRLELEELSPGAPTIILILTRVKIIVDG